jgi:hypothetical protein
MMPPGFQLVVRQNPLDRLGRDGRNHAVTDQLPGQFRAIPLRQGTAKHVRALASQLDHIQRHCWGKKPAAGRGVFYRTTR